MGTTEPQVGLTGKPLPLDTVTNVSYINDKEASFLRDPYLPLKSSCSEAWALYTFTDIGCPSIKTIFHLKEEGLLQHFLTNGENWLTPLFETLAQTWPFSPHGFDSKLPKFSPLLGSLRVPPVHRCQAQIRATITTTGSSYSYLDKAVL